LKLNVANAVVASAVAALASIASSSLQSFNIFLQSFSGTSRDAVIYHKMSVYVNFIAHKIKEAKCTATHSSTHNHTAPQRPLPLPPHRESVTKCPAN